MNEYKKSKEFVSDNAWRLASNADEGVRVPKGREILIAPNEPSAGVRVAFILDDGAPVELLEFDAGHPQ